MLESKFYLQDRRPTNLLSLNFGLKSNVNILYELDSRRIDTVFTQ